MISAFIDWCYNRKNIVHSYNDFIINDRPKINAIIPILTASGLSRPGNIDLTFKIVYNIAVKSNTLDIRPITQQKISIFAR